jgi:hypothetical protein
MRQDAPGAAYASGGHAMLLEEQVSKGSQVPSAGRHITVGATVDESGVQVPSAVPPAWTLQAWQSLGSPPPQEVEQHTSSAQNPDAQSLPLKHSAIL